jgi:ParB family transcriptional regulator, chromosome partitioning protein
LTNKAKASKSTVICKTATKIEFREIPISQITVGERVRQDPIKGLESLMKSIEFFGLLQPIVVKEQENKGTSTFLLIAGERRLEAFKRLGRQTIPARIERSTSFA